MTSPALPCTTLLATSGEGLGLLTLFPPHPPLMTSTAFQPPPTVPLRFLRCAECEEKSYWDLELREVQEDTDGGGIHSQVRERIYGVTGVQCLFTARLKFSPKTTYPPLFSF